ncbi:MAG TPA: hypothetical protein VGU67_06790 [Edaphobacter sp.]|nr:hypothetical protein [Edaphobacter sp.]
MKLLKYALIGALGCSAVAQGPDAAKSSPAKSEAFHNSSTDFETHAVSIVQQFTFDTFDPRHLIGHNNLYKFDTPGFSWGNAGGWSVQLGTSEDGTFNTRGIGQMHLSRSVKHATGDFAAQYIYASTDGGATAQSDEGFTLDTREGGETDGWFHGKAAAGAASGTTLLPVSYVAGPHSQEATTDGAYMLDISKGAISGAVTGQETLVEGTSVHILPVSARLPPSTGIGVVDTSIPRIKVANTPESITLTGVRLIRGSFVAGKACLAGGWYPEQVVVTKAGQAVHGLQDVTIIHKNPNGADAKNPTSLWQGGICGQYLSLDRNVARDGFPTSYEVVGATDSSHLAYLWNVKGGTKLNVLRVYRSPVALKNLSRSKGVVTATFALANQPYIFNHAASVVIAGAGRPSFNGTVALPSYEDDANRKLSWSQPGPDETAASATIDLPASYYGFHLYPGAEVLGPQVAGGVPLEPNSVEWAPGDVIENPHNPSFYMGGRGTGLTQHTLPSSSNSFGQMWGFSGSGISANYYPSEWRNFNPCSLYIGCGGTLEPILWSSYVGPYSRLISVRTAPLNEGTLITVGCDERGCEHKSPYRLFQLQNGAMDYDPEDGTVTVPKMSASLLSGHLNGPLTTTQIDLEDPKSAGQGLTITNANGRMVIRPQGQQDGALPSSDAAASVQPGPANTGGVAACARGYRCTANRGRVTLAAATASATGTIASVRTALAAGEICTAVQNGGTAFFGIGGGNESAKGFDITAAIALHGTVTVDYTCR